MLKQSGKLKIWLADLIHDQVIPLSVVPLNLGYLAGALEQTFGDEVSVELFKYPRQLCDRLRADPPAVIGLSNYTWNSRLSNHFCRLTKLAHPDTLVVMGGPNIRVEPEEIRKFLIDRPEVDVYIPREAETPMVHLVRSLLAQGPCSNATQLFAKAGQIPGCYLNVADYEFAGLSKKETQTNLSYGSPYLKGLLDEFIRDPNLVPLFETNRGCPYPCTFCVWGSAALNKLRERDVDEVIEEFRYVATRGAGHDYWYFADANFGLVRRDLDLAREIRRLREIHGSPKHLNLNWAKNSSERLIEIVSVLKDLVPGQIAVQSMDENVLKAIKRVNLQPAVIARLIAAYHDQDLPVATDILIGCSGESLASHYETMRRVFEVGYDLVNINPIRMLPGAEIESDADRERYGLRSRFRLIPNSYGMYGWAEEFVYEIEEAICATNEATEDELISLKVPHFLIYLLWNIGLAKHLLRFGLGQGVNPMDVVLALSEQKEHRRGGYGSILIDLANEYKQDWFDTEADLRRYYDRSEVYGKLFGEDRSEKLTWKYMARLLLEPQTLPGLIRDVVDYLARKTSADPRCLDLIAKISKDKLKLDFDDRSTLRKTVSYQATPDVYETLVDARVIPSGSTYDGSQLTLKYNYTESDFEYLQRLLARFSFGESPRTALVFALGCGAQAYLTYSIESDLSADIVRVGRQSYEV